LIEILRLPTGSEVAPTLANAVTGVVYTIKSAPVSK
jgi:hypothetical protein